MSFYAGNQIKNFKSVEQEKLYNSARMHREKPGVNISHLTMEINSSKKMEALKIKAEAKIKKRSQTLIRINRPWLKSA